jgi:transposase
MARRTFTVVDVVEILQHWYAGRPKVEVARSLGVDPKTVRRYVAAAEAAGLSAGGPPVSDEQWRARAREWFPALADFKLRQPSWGQIDAYRELIETLVGVVPMSVIHQRLRDEHGLEASVASVRRYMRAHFDQEIRAGQVTIWRPPVDPGDEAQVDYGYLGTWTDPASGRRRKVWAFSMVLAYSRHLFVFPVLRMDQQAWVDAHLAAFSFLGGCPRRVVLDNLRAGVIKPDIYDPKINRAYAELAAHYGVLVDPARVGHPKDKPRIEAVQLYVRRSFFAGRDFASLAAMVAEAQRWSREVAGQRTPRVLEGRTPAQVFDADERGVLLPLPVMPFELARWSHPKVGPDAHAKLGKTLYSLPYRLIGRHVDARATNLRVQFYLDGTLVKTHPFKARGRQTDWGDLPAERVGFFMRNPSWCLAQAAMVGEACQTLVGDLLSVNALFRLRQAQGVLRFGQKYGDDRLEAACRRAIDAGDPSYKTVKGILAAGTERLPMQTRLAVDAPAWLHGPAAFEGEERS